MKGIILAGGQGTRLRPLTFAIPKPLLPVGGIPAIDYAIKNLMKIKSIDEIYVGVSYQKEIIEEYLAHMEYGIPITPVSTLGWETGGDLKCITHDLDLYGQVAVAYGDIITDIDMGEMLRFHEARKVGTSYGTLALFKVPWADAHRFGVAEMSEDKQFIKSFVEKPEKPKSNLANAGYYILEENVYYRMLTFNKEKVENNLFKTLVEMEELKGFIAKPKYWQDIGTIASYRKANKLLEGILPPCKVIK